MSTQFSAEDSSRLLARDESHDRQHFPRSPIRRRTDLLVSQDLQIGVGVGVEQCIGLEALLRASSASIDEKNRSQRSAGSRSVAFVSSRITARPGERLTASAATSTTHRARVAILRTRALDNPAHAVAMVTQARGPALPPIHTIFTRSTSTFHRHPQPRFKPPCEAARMSKLKDTFRVLLDLAGGTPPTDQLGSARRRQLLAAAGLLSVAFAGVWGLAAGSGSLALAAANVFKVPMVVLLSALSAVPVGLLANRLLGSPMRPSDLLLGMAASVFAGTLVLAVLSPLVAVYYHTSTWAGPTLALGSASLATLVSIGLLLRSAVRSRPEDKKQQLGPVVLPVVSIALMELAVMVQLIALAAPILPEETRFDGGIDQLVQR